MTNIADIIAANPGVSIGSHNIAQYAANSTPASEPAPSNSPPVPPAPTVPVGSTTTRMQDTVAAQMADPGFSDLPAIQQAHIQAQAQSLGVSTSPINTTQDVDPASPAPPTQKESSGASQLDWFARHIDPSTGKVDVASAQSEVEAVNVGAPKPTDFSRSAAFAKTQTDPPTPTAIGPLQAGADPTQASDAELWATVRTGAPGFSGSGVSGSTYHGAVVELAERQRQAALNRARTGAVDVSLDSSRGAFVEAGAIGPQQWLPEGTDPGIVDYWRSREDIEQYYAAPSGLTVGEGDEAVTYYKPTGFKTTQEWFDAMGYKEEPAPLPKQFQDVSAGTQPPPQLNIPIGWIETGTGSAFNAPTPITEPEQISLGPGTTTPQFDQNYYDLAISMGYDENGANYFAFYGVDPATYGVTEQAGTSITEIIPTSPVETFTGDAQGDIMFNDPNLLYTDDEIYYLPEGWMPQGAGRSVFIPGTGRVPVEELSNYLPPIDPDRIYDPNAGGNAILASLSDPQGLVGISGVTSLPDEGDAWELAVGGPQIESTVIQGQRGYAYVDRGKGGSTRRIEAELATMGRPYPI